MTVVASPLWTPDEDERLRAMALSGASVAAIAKQIKRSKAAVRGRAYKLSIPVAKSRKLLQKPRLTVKK
jgi:hypothetical protein